MAATKLKSDDEKDVIYLKIREVEQIISRHEDLLRQILKERDDWKQKVTADSNAKTISEWKDHKSSHNPPHPHPIKHHLVISIIVLIQKLQEVIDTSIQVIHELMSKELLPMKQRCDECLTGH